MMKEKHLVLFCMTLILSSCQVPSEYFNRKKVVPAINSNCTGFQNGEITDVTNWISVSPEEYEYLREYYQDKEYRLFKCLKYNRCK